MLKENCIKDAQFNSDDLVGGRDYMNDEIMYTVNYEIKEIDPYMLPLNIYLIGEVKSIRESMPFPRSEKERKWLSAVIILGQPFA